MPGIIQQGEGLPIVVVPGIQGRWEWMAPTMDALAAHGRAITYSLCDEPTSGFAWSTERGFENYRRNLEQILSVADVARAKVLITTQAIMMWDMLGTNRECEQTQVDSFLRIQEIQREVALARGVPLAETGKRIADEEDRHFRDTGEHLFKNDVHPFDAGSELIARAIADALREAKLLP